MNTNLWEEVTPAVTAGGKGGSVHPGTVSQVFPLDFCFVLSRQSCGKDRTGTVVELLDPLGTGCCQKGLALGLLPLPWDHWGK